jgi:hypothetical protein
MRNAAGSGSIPFFDFPEGPFGAFFPFLYPFCLFSLFPSRSPFLPGGWGIFLQKQNECLFFSGPVVYWWRPVIPGRESLGLSLQA